MQASKKLEISQVISPYEKAVYIKKQLTIKQNKLNSLLERNFINSPYDIYKLINLL